MDLKTYISAGGRGTAVKLAGTLHVSPSYLSQMVSGSSPISPERCVAIERATNGSVTRKDLRPSDWHLIWPELAISHAPADLGASSEAGDESV
nr:YdaS family helix-turn-helix protein [Cupriavidus sp. WS]